MGPPIYIGGNLVRRLQGAEPVPEASMGPPIYIGGNRWLPKIPYCQFHGFNGATDLHRWKLQHGAGGGLRLQASMGPPIYIGGNNEICELHIGPKKCFNGATDLHRWKQTIGKGDLERILRLQWGHRFTSVETSERIISYIFRLFASMGPPIYIGGNKTDKYLIVGVIEDSMGPPIYIGGNAWIIL
mgnify:CR=1 FL=1